MNKPIERARLLRTNSTDAEKFFWHHVRNRQFEDLKFKRQQPFPPYTADFFCEEYALIVEIDGGQHSEEIDANRDRFLISKGFTILHYWNNDVLKI